MIAQAEEARRSLTEQLAAAAVFEEAALETVFRNRQVELESARAELVTVSSEAQIASSLLAAEEAARRAAEEAARRRAAEEAARRAAEEAARRAAEEAAAREAAARAEAAAAAKAAEDATRLAAEAAAAKEAARLAAALAQASGDELAAEMAREAAEAASLAAAEAAGAEARAEAARRAAEAAAAEEAARLARLAEDEAARRRAAEEAARRAAEEAARLARLAAEAEADMEARRRRDEAERRAAEEGARRAAEAAAAEAAARAAAESEALREQYRRAHLRTELFSNESLLFAGVEDAGIAEDTPAESDEEASSSPDSMLPTAPAPAPPPPRPPPKPKNEAAAALVGFGRFKVAAPTARAATDASFLDGSFTLGGASSLASSDADAGSRVGTADADAAEAKRKRMNFKTLTKLIKTSSRMARTAQDAKRTRDLSEQRALDGKRVHQPLKLDTHLRSLVGPPSPGEPIEFRVGGIDPLMRLKVVAEEEEGKPSWAGAGRRPGAGSPQPVATTANAAALPSLPPHTAIGTRTALPIAPTAPTAIVPSPRKSLSPDSMLRTAPASPPPLHPSDSMLPTAPASLPPLHPPDSMLPTAPVPPPLRPPPKPKNEAAAGLVGFGRFKAGAPTPMAPETRDSRSAPGSGAMGYTGAPKGVPAASGSTELQQAASPPQYAYATSRYPLSPMPRETPSPAGYHEFSRLPTPTPFLGRVAASPRVPTSPGDGATPPLRHIVTAASLMPQGWEAAHLRPISPTEQEPDALLELVRQRHSLSPSPHPIAPMALDTALDSGRAAVRSVGGTLLDAARGTGPFDAAADAAVTRAAAIAAKSGLSSRPTTKAGWVQSYASLAAHVEHWSSRETLHRALAVGPVTGVPPASPRTNSRPATVAAKSRPATVAAMDRSRTPWQAPLSPRIRTAGRHSAPPTQLLPTQSPPQLPPPQPPDALLLSPTGTEAPPSAAALGCLRPPPVKVPEVPLPLGGMHSGAASSAHVTGRALAVTSARLPSLSNSGVVGSAAGGPPSASSAVSPLSQVKSSQVKSSSAVSPLTRGSLSSGTPRLRTPVKPATPDSRAGGPRYHVRVLRDPTGPAATGSNQWSAGLQPGLRPEVLVGHGTTDSSLSTIQHWGCDSITQDVL